MVELVDKNLLKKFVPANALNADNYRELSGKTTLESIAAGKAVFSIGQTDRKTVFLVEGELVVRNNSGKTSLVRAGTEAARHAIANNQPRKHTVIAKVPSKIIRIDSDLLDVLITWDQLSGIEVGEIATEDDDDDEDVTSDWMTRILQSKAFFKVPPANIQAMFMRIEEIPASQGDTIIRQGDTGDYYYMIKLGNCKVTRTSKTGSELVLAELNDGDAFGEEALLSEEKRNANVIMTSNGRLMRLSKQDFNELLKEPMLSWVSRAEAKKLVAAGGVWLDVRLSSEHKNNAIKGSANIPLFMLRMKAEKLDPKTNYVVYCDTGRRSSAGAFLLSERGLRAYCLTDGFSTGAA